MKVCICHGKVCFAMAFRHFAMANNLPWQIRIAMARFFLLLPWQICHGNYFFKTSQNILKLILWHVIGAIVMFLLQSLIFFILPWQIFAIEMPWQISAMANLPWQFHGKNLPWQFNGKNLPWQVHGNYKKVCHGKILSIKKTTFFLWIFFYKFIHGKWHIKEYNV